MSYKPDCAFCIRMERTCMECGACFREHCECDPCQHGKARADINSCVFCRPALSFADDIVDTALGRTARVPGGPGPEDKDEEEPPLADEGDTD